ncbi:hypothetical protein VP01_2851g3 [Puccinia sorghi]|uniref:Uncharacterized protein n=1 Tax=Puccinia sorghi TaxID=27349 RepID=A0A0L6V2T6_9BASI|nr:hypothetical protein VP01_2851g3 [Puccinia sorghi]
MGQRKKATISTVYRGLFLLHSDLVVIVDPNHNKSIIAVLKFIPWDRLTKNDKIKLDFVSTFLHGSKEFISPTSKTCPVEFWGLQLQFCHLEWEMEENDKGNEIGTQPDPYSVLDHVEVISKAQEIENSAVLDNSSVVEHKDVVEEGQVVKNRAGEHIDVMEEGQEF